ncbi:MAG: CoA-binding protein [Dehalococcoidia bacterium]
MTDDTFARIDAIFRPRSVAVVGASANPDTPGYDYVKSMQEFGFKGDIYPVNPKGGEILGLPVYGSVGDIPGDVDYVISCIPADHILDVVRDCGKRNVKALQLFTGRFSETGREEDAEAERHLLNAALTAGVRLIGPNCMGLLYPEHGMSFRGDMSHEPGNIGFLSQSGNLLFEITHYGGPRGLRFSKAISYGNGVDLDESDFMTYFGDDPETKVVGAYVEGVRDGRRFLDALKRASANKPVVVLKGGRTRAGGRAAASHTAALAGASAVWDAALAQAGCLAVDTVEHLIDMLLAFSRMQPGTGRRLGMVGSGGGRSVLTADLCEELGLAVPPLPTDVEAKVAERAPGLAGWVTNPVDQSILASSGVGGGQVLEWFDDSPEIDLLLANMNEAWAFGRPNAAEILPRIADRFIKVGERTRKPYAVVLGPSDYPEQVRWQMVSDMRERLATAGLALYPSVERAVRALAAFTTYWQRRA